MDHLSSVEIEIFPQPVRGEVERLIAPDERGRVTSIGSSWFAELYEPNSQTVLMPGQKVIVVGRKLITLLVKPA